MLSTLVTRKNAKTLPIVVVDDASFPGWRKQQGKAVQRWLDASTFEPRGNRASLIPGARGPKLALFGSKDASPWAWAGAAQRLPPGRYRLDTELEEAAATDAAIGWALSAYRFDRYKSEAAAAPRELVWPKAADRAEVARVVEAIGLARDLINTPAGDLGPAEGAETAKRLGAAHGAKVTVTHGKRLEAGYPMIHAVGRGSARGPRLIDLRWGSKDAPSVTLVGKGVVFDSGGLDLKNAAGMLRMKKDMGGAAIVLGLAKLIMDAELPVRLRVLVPTVENLPGADAYRPLDVLRSKHGKTVEISNTDAEGRLILADALAEADAERPDLLIDVATLTGSARLALGAEISAFFTSDAKLAEALARAGRQTGDHVWRLPLHRAYRRHLDSRVADLKNAASTSLGGAITAALFLSEFVEHAGSWLHLDVHAWNDGAKPGRPTGGEATALRALWAMLRERAAAH